MALSGKLAELDAAIVAAKQRVREVDLEVRAAKAKAEEARNQVIEGYAAGNDDAAIKKLEKAHAEVASSAARLTDANWLACSAPSSVPRLTASHSSPRIMKRFSMSDARRRRRLPEASRARSLRWPRLMPSGGRLRPKS